MKFPYIHLLILAGFWSFVALPALSDGCLRQSQAFSSEHGRYVEYQSEKPITFGLENEVNILDNPKIVLDYRLQSFTPAQWEKLTFKKKVNYAKAAVESHKKDFHVPLFRKLPHARQDLPEILLTEGNGNIEFNGFVFSNHKELRVFTEWMASRYGPGSFQAHVVWPITKIDGIAGYAVFMSDMAQLQTLKFGYDKHLKQPAFIPGRNLLHPALGPLNKVAADKFIEQETRAASGEPLLTVEQLGNAKSVLGPTILSSVYPKGLMGIELRQYHKRFSEMLGEADNFSFHLHAQKGLRSFKPFAEASLIDSSTLSSALARTGRQKDFDLLLGVFNKFGQKIEQDVAHVYFAGASAVERLLFPLRNWQEHPLVLQLPSRDRSAMEKNLEQASLAYLDYIKTLEKTPATKESTEALLIEYAKWGQRSRLYELFETFHKNELANDS